MNYRQIKILKYNMHILLTTTMKKPLSHQTVYEKEIINIDKPYDKNALYADMVIFQISMRDTARNLAKLFFQAGGPKYSFEKVQEIYNFPAIISEVHQNIEELRKRFDQETQEILFRTSEKEAVGHARSFDPESKFHRAMVVDAGYFHLDQTKSYEELFNPTVIYNELLNSIYNISKNYSNIEEERITQYFIEQAERYYMHLGTSISRAFKALRDKLPANYVKTDDMKDAYNKNVKTIIIQ